LVIKDEFWDKIIDYMNIFICNRLKQMILLNQQNTRLRRQKTRH